MEKHQHFKYLFFAILIKNCVRECIWPKIYIGRPIIINTQLAIIQNRELGEKRSHNVFFVSNSIVVTLIPKSSGGQSSGESSFEQILKCVAIFCF